MSQLIARHFAGALWSTVKSALMVTGLVALVAWQVDASGARARVNSPAPRNDIAEALDSVQPARVAAETLALADDPTPAQAAEHKRIAGFLARKYKVATDATHSIVGATYAVAREVGVDPLLVLAVMAIESRMNPYAESVMGAKGLMQVIPKYHLDKFEELGGPEAVFNPVANIKVGALILKDYLTRYGGIESGLRAYSGATGDDGGYAAKVLAERDRLLSAAATKRTVTAKAPARVTPRAETPSAEPRTASSRDDSDV